MSLRTKTLLLIFFTALISLAGVILALNYVLSLQFSSLEHREVSEHAKRVESSLENILNQLVAKTTDWAQWDDTYQFMQNLNAEYLHSNVSFETLSAISLAHVIYRDEQGVLVKGFQVDYSGEEVKDLSNAAMKAFVADPVTKPGEQPEDIRSGVLQIDGLSYLFAAVPIFDSRRSESTRGSLLFSMVWDESFTKMLAEQTRLKLRLFDWTSIQDTDVSILEKLRKSQLNTFVLPASEIVNGFLVIKDINQQPIQVVELTLPRDIYAQGRHVINWLMVALVVVIVITLFVLAIVLDKWILSRLFGLENQVSRLDPKKLEGARVETSGSDEITNLGHAVNQFLVELEDAHIQVKDARMLAEQANRAKSIFIARVSHEMRNPIGGILGLNRLIMKREKSQAIRDLIGMSDQAATSCLAIINEILDFSKAESGELDFENIKFDPRQLVRDTMQIMAARLEAKDNKEGAGELELVASVASQVPSFLISDPSKLKQVLINLLSNAIKFTESGFVGLKLDWQVGSSTTQGQLVFTVWDTGIGIAADKLDTVFKPYKQADETVARQYHGTGLGLSIVKQFVEGMAGQIKLESKVGKGSKFILELPMTVDTDSRFAAKPAAIFQECAFLGIESLAYTTLAKDLEQIGCSVKLADISQLDESVNLEALSQANFLVLTEQAWSLPWIERLIHKRINRDNIHTVAILQPGSLELRDRCYAIGVNQVFIAPVLAEDLVASNQIPPEPARKPSVTSTLASRSLKVLIADDMPTNRLILREMLKDAGHEVVEVCDGQALLDKLLPLIKGDAQAEHFDIVITDITMPLIDGDAATRQAREVEKVTPGAVHIPILAVTGHAFREEVDKINKSGVDGVLIKPVEPEQLQQHFNRLLNV